MDRLVRVLGLTPHNMFRYLARFRGAIIRTGATMTYERIDDKSLRMTLDGIPPSHVRKGNAGLTMAGLYEGVLSFAGVDGRAFVEEENDELGCVSHVVRW